ncbi:hypothetical protein HMPREF9108_00165 [Leptotrichia sp. oral taxon 225 str. F0581]|nr:hypothetical protein HMPREF9108_00165 [Leptotrichia sp. oral taxon 225 str. F0581]
MVVFISPFVGKIKITEVSIFGSSNNYSPEVAKMILYLHFPTRQQMSTIFLITFYSINK